MRDPSSARLKPANSGKMALSELLVKLSEDVILAVLAHHDGWPKSGCLIAASD